MEYMTVRIRDYAESDREACLAVFDGNVPEYFDSTERGEFEAFLADLPGPYLVLADTAGRVVGCGGFAIERGSTTADLCWGMIVRDRQGAGLGRQLTEARLARIRRIPSVRHVSLTTSQLTRGFYERLGFVTVRTVRDGFAPGLDRCEMRLSLGESDRGRASG